MGISITYPHTVPSLNDPATFNDRALQFLSWATGQGNNELLGQLADIDSADYFGVQSDLTDTTSGRLMKVGAFGLGAAKLQVAEHIVSDMDDAALPYGAYAVINTTSGTRPSGSSDYGVLEVKPLVGQGQGGTEQVTQIFHPASATPEMYMRHYRSGSWSSWWRLDPERGANANGEYVRFADGTQLCNVSLAADLGGTVTWTYPAAFASLPRVIATAATSGPRFASISGETSTAAGLNAWNDDGTRSATGCRIFAMGRWY